MSRISVSPFLVSLLVLFVATLVADVPAQGRGRNGIKKGEWKSKKDVPEGWIVYRTRRYTFQSNAPLDRVKRVAAHLKAAYKLYEKKFPSGRTPKRPFVVKIFKNRPEFIAYGAPPSAGAYYSWRDKEMVGYDTGKIDGEVKSAGVTGKPKGLRERIRRLRANRAMDLLGVFAHEGWHQYFHFTCASKVEFPSWCDEGIGEYFYSMRYRQKKYLTGDPNDYRLGTIQRHIKAGTFIPLKDLVTFNQRKYYSDASKAYAQGWALVHFFLEHPKYKKKRYLQRFVKTFIAQHSIDKAVKTVFSSMDWPTVTDDWKAWVMAMKVPGKAGDDDADAAEARRKALERLGGGLFGGEKPPGGGEKKKDPKKD
ncbi:MAG: hypothetical protein CMJ83_22175 [Planctomycetes bacterium]|nr:hypothetical protein [Planctomycetota bacterium]